MANKNSKETVYVIAGQRTPQLKADSKRGVAITDPRSHASLARNFLAEFCEEHGIRYCDTHDAFDGRSAAALEELRVHPEDYHFSAPGHAIVAAAAADYLVRNGLLDRAETPLR